MSKIVGYGRFNRTAVHLAGLFGQNLISGINLRRYGPCADCGNPCKGASLCHKCQVKRGSVQKANEGGASEPFAEQAASPTLPQVRVYIQPERPAELQADQPADTQVVS